MTVRTITGNVNTLAGVDIPNATFSLVPETYVFGSTTSDAIFGEQVTVTADSNGDVSFDLHEGKYVGRISTSQGAKTFRLTVDGEGPWTLGRLLGELDPITSSLAAQVFDARDAAILAQTGAETAETAAAASAATATTQANIATGAAILAGAPIAPAFPTDDAETAALASPFLFIAPEGIQSWTHTDTFASLTQGPYVPRIEFPTVAALLGSTATSLGPTGQIIYAGGFRYEVVTTGEHVTTAGGVKLYAQPPYNVEAFGARGDGSTDDTDAVTDAAQAGWALVGEGVHPVDMDAASGYVTKGLIGTSPESEVTNATADAATIIVDDTGYTRPDNAYVADLKITGPNTDATNNFADLSIWAEFSSFIGNYIPDVSAAVSLSYKAADDAGAEAAFGGTIAEFTNNSPVDQPGRGSLANVVAFNSARNIAIIGYQFFCAAHTRAIGNTIYNDSASTSHGYRLTGYPGFPSNFNTLSANTARKTLNGLSVQTATRFNTISGLAVDDPTFAGVYLNPNSVYADWHHGHNYIQGVSQGGDYGVIGARPEYNRIDWIVDGAALFGLSLANDGTYGENRGNIVDGIVTNSVEGAFINSSYNHIRVLLSQIDGRGVVLSGSGNIVDVICDTPSLTTNTFSLQVAGNSNMVKLVAFSNAHTVDVSISGDDNILDLMAAKSVSVTGDRNIFRGHINLTGSTNIVNSGTGNDFSGLFAASGTYANIATTDANGLVTMTHPHNRPQGSGITYYAVGQLVATTAAAHAGRTVAYKGTTSANNFQFVVCDEAGAALASTSVAISFTWGPIVT